jgi:hypothetical protein
VQRGEVEGGEKGKLWSHERVLAVRCDVRLKDQVEQAVKRTLERFGNLDIVVKYSRLWEIMVVVPDGGLLLHVRNKRTMKYGVSLRRMSSGRLT